eukprot:scaffold5217_cov80-Skeletonema_dohrnii-CCMP3373.AAC.6
MAQVGYWFARSQSAGGAQSSVKLGGGRFSDQPTALARTIPKYTPRAENTVHINLYFLACQLPSGGNFTQ